MLQPFIPTKNCCKNSSLHRSYSSVVMFTTVYFISHQI